MNYEHIITDLLVIGAGGAGIRAAIEAKKQGLDVLLLGKEVLGCAHTGMAMGGMNVALVPPATPEFHAQITLEGGYFINNYKMVEVFAEEMPARIHDLESYGVIYDRRDNGDYYVWAGPKQKYPLNICVGDYTGRELMQGLVDQARKLGVPYSDEFFISKLFTKDNVIVGAMGINLKTGTYVVFQTKAIILATGGAGRMYEVTTNAASNTGDGYAMALDCGAQLIDMEMVQFHPTGMAYPPSSRGVLVTEKVRALGGILRNKNSERFMSRYYPKEMELAKRDEVSRSIFTEVEAGRGTKHNAVYLHVQHFGIEKILEQIPDVYQLYKSTGVDISKNPLEVYPSMHHMMGGIRVDEWGKTSLRGLFACGEVTGGVHGANRLGGNSIAEGQVFGRRAAISSSRYAKKIHLPSPAKRDIKQEIEKITSYITKKNGVAPHEIEAKLKKLMWQKVGIFRNEKGLQTAQSELETLQKEAQHMKARSRALPRNRDLQDILEIANMLTTAASVIQGALMRKESRGAHSRLDFPKSNKKWEKNIVISLKNDSLKTKIIPVIK